MSIFTCSKTEETHLEMVATPVYIFVPLMRFRFVSGSFQAFFFLPKVCIPVQQYLVFLCGSTAFAYTKQVLFVIPSSKQFSCSEGPALDAFSFIFFYMILLLNSADPNL